MLRNDIRRIRRFGDVEFFSTFLRKTPSLALLVTLELGTASKLNSKVTDASLHIVAARCPALASLNVSSRAITDKPIIKLARPALTSLDIGLCDKVTDVGFRAIAQNCPGLTYLRANFCEQMTDASLGAIATNCPSLATLSVMGCRKLTSSSFMAVGTNLPSLQALTVCLLTQDAITDAVLECIAAGCPRLTKLDISHRQLITDRSLECLAANCPRLSVLNIGGCPLITDRSLDEIVANCSITELNLHDTRVTYEKYRAYLDPYTRDYVNRLNNPDLPQPTFDLSEHSSDYDSDEDEDARDY